MRDFINNDTHDDLAKSIFTESFNAKDTTFSSLLEELRDIAAICEVEENSKKMCIVFATLVPPVNQDLPYAYPLSDLSKIELSDVELIPEYIKSYGFKDTVGEIDRVDYLRFIKPPILDTASDFLSYWAYIIDDEPYCQPALLAAILYELTLLGENIHVSDTRKEEIKHELDSIRREQGIDLPVEELFIESGFHTNPCQNKHQDQYFDSFHLSRYNARIATCERLHFDAVRTFGNGGIS